MERAATTGGRRPTGCWRAGASPAHLYTVPVHGRSRLLRRLAEKGRADGPVVAAGTSDLPKDSPLQVLPKIAWADQKPTYQQAETRRHRRRAAAALASERQLVRPSPRTDVRTDRPFGTTVAGWTSSPGATGASSSGRRPARIWEQTSPPAGVECGGLISARGTAYVWRAAGSSAGSRYPAMTTACGCGCVWTRSAARSHWTPGPPARPTGPQLAAVTRLEGVCEPRDIIANRLDPWHARRLVPPVLVRSSSGCSAPPVDADEESDVFQTAINLPSGPGRRSRHRGIHRSRTAPS